MNANQLLLFCFAGIITCQAAMFDMHILGEMVYREVEAVDIIETPPRSICQHVFLHSVDTDPIVMKGMLDDSSDICAKLDTEAKRYNRMETIIDGLVFGIVVINGEWKRFKIEDISKQQFEMKQILALMLNATQVDKNTTEIQGSESRPQNRSLKYMAGLEDMLIPRLSRYFLNKAMFDEEFLSRAGFVNASLSDISQAVTPFVRSCSGTEISLKLCVQARETGHLVEVMHPGAFNKNRTEYNYFDMPTFFRNAKGDFKAIDRFKCDLNINMKKIWRYNCTPNALNNTCQLTSGEGCQVITDPVVNGTFTNIHIMEHHVFVATTEKEYRLREHVIWKRFEVPESGIFVMILNELDELHVANFKVRGTTAQPTEIYHGMNNILEKQTNKMENEGKPWTTRIRQSLIYYFVMMLS